MPCRKRLVKIVWAMPPVWPMAYRAEPETKGTARLFIKPLRRGVASPHIRRRSRLTVPQDFERGAG